MINLQHDVFAIQPGSLHSTNEELRTIGARSCVGHWQNTRSSVLEAKIFVLKFVAVNRLATGAVVVGKITTLAHKVWDDTMEYGALEAKTFLAGAQGTEILGSSGNHIGTEL